MNYEEMSDNQIAMAVAMTIEGVGFDDDVNPLFAVDCFCIGKAKGRGCHVIWADRDRSEYFDPCSNPSDAWPIIVENKIDLAHTVSGDANCAVFKVDKRGLYREFYTTTSKNPLRAAMICFLKMKDSEK